MVEFLASNSSAMTEFVSSDEPVPEASPVKWWHHAPNEFHQAIVFNESQQQGRQNFGMWYRQTTTSLGEDHCQLTAKELGTFDKEMKQFFNAYKSRIGSESG